MEIKSWWTNPSRGKIHRCVFQGNSFLLRFFVVEMMSLDYIFRKCTRGNIFTKPQEKNNHLIHKDDIKIFEKELETQIQIIRIYSQDNGWNLALKKCAMLIMKSGKRETTEGIYIYIYIYMYICACVCVCVCVAVFHVIMFG